MNVVEHVPANFPDKILGKQERNLTDPPVPFSEREYFKTDNHHACANVSAPIIHEVAPAIEANSDIHRLERIVTGPHVSTIPDDEASIPSSKPSKKTSLFSGKGIVISAMLGLAIGIAIGSDWSWPHSLTENWKSNNLRGVLETIFADASKGQRAVQAAPAAANVTTPDFSEIQNQLNAIARGLSSVQQNINELTAGQEQMRKAQGQLAVLQAHLVNLQTVANAKQNKQSSPTPTEGRKFYRGDSRYIFR